MEQVPEIKNSQEKPTLFEEAVKEVEEREKSQNLEVEARETDKSLISKKSIEKIGVRTSKNHIQKELLDLVFELQIKTQMSRREIAEKMGFEGKIKVEGYLTNLINNFDKYWPKTLEAQKRILEKLERGKKLLTEQLNEAEEK